jgi:hypothetical protein
MARATAGQEPGARESPRVLSISGGVLGFFSTLGRRARLSEPNGYISRAPKRSRGDRSGGPSVGYLSRWDLTYPYILALSPIIINNFVVNF